MSWSPKKWVIKVLFVEEGGKRTLNKTRVIACVVAAIFFGIAGTIVSSCFKREDNSHLKRSDTPLTVGGATPASTQKVQSAPLGGIADRAPKTQSRTKGVRGPPVHYRARQVLLPGDGLEKIANGSNFIGRLLSGIDTRSLQLVRVELPYGGSDKNGTGSFPPGTILFGQPTYPSQGERVFINFDHGVLPGGEEIKIQAQALSAKDYSPGIIGIYHGNKSTRIAAALGLSMVSGVSDVMVEKESVGGQVFEATPKSTIRNGLYNGLSKVAETESQNEMNSVGETPAYATVDEGFDVIISLVAPYRNTNAEQQ